MKTAKEITDLLTLRILAAVADTVEEIPDGDDLGPVFSAMASAYAAFALQLGGKDFAKDMLGLVADRLDDPVLLQAIRRGGNA